MLVHRFDVCAILSVGVVSEESLVTELIKLGVVGIVLGYMLLKDRERQKRDDERQNTADQRWAETNKQLFSYLERNTDAHAQTGAAVKELTDELRHRPCIKERDKSNG